MLTKTEIKKRIATYESSLKRWQAEEKQIKKEISNCREMIRKYKAELKKL